MPRKHRPQTEAYISPQEVSANKNNVERYQANHDNSSKSKLLQKRREGMDVKAVVSPANRSNIIDGSNNTVQASLSHITHEIENIIPVHNESPWRHYQGIVTALDFGGSVVIARKKGNCVTRFGVRQFAGQNAKDVLSYFRNIRHANIVAGIEAFADAGALYVVVEEMHMPLTCIIKSPADPDGQQIATIIGQIVDALVFLEQHKLSHGAMDGTCVLVHNAGDIKITIHDSCVPSSPESRAKDLNDLCKITMKLMQGYVLENDKVGVETPSRWMDSGLIEFLPATKSSDSVTKLRQSSFLQDRWAIESRWPTEELCDLVLIAQYAVHRQYRYMNTII